MTRPWSQDLTLRWEPELTFYERRVEILRFLEAEGQLFGFNVSDRSVEAQLATNAMLTFSPAHFALTFVGQDVDLENLRKVLAYVCTVIDPRRYRFATAGFQYVIPLSASYDVARRSYIDAFMPAVVGDTAGFHDFSILLDESAGQVEMGVIDRSEVVARLTRTQSRMGRPDEGRTSLIASQLEDAELPDVAFFADWKRHGATSSLDSFLEWWEEALFHCAAKLGNVQDFAFVADSEPGTSNRRAEGRGTA